MHKLEKYAKEIRLFDSDEKTSQTVEQVENKEVLKNKREKLKLALTQLLLKLRFKRDFFSTLKKRVLSF